jgi:hypothetical protein
MGSKTQTLKTASHIWLLVVVASWLEPASAASGLFGVSSHITQVRKHEVELLSRAFQVARSDFRWSDIERQRGEYDFSVYDNLLRALISSNVTAYWIFDYGNPHYDNGAAPHTVDGLAGFSRFVTKAMDHFGGKGIIWEVWNEPNGGFWKPSANVTAYANLVMAVCQIPGVHQETIVGPGYAPLHLEMNFTWLETLFQTSTVLDCFDAISVHPYRTDGPESAIADYHTLRALIQRYFCSLEPQLLI